MARLAWITACSCWVNKDEEAGELAAAAAAASWSSLVEVVQPSSILKIETVASARACWVASFRARRSFSSAGAAGAVFPAGAYSKLEASTARRH
jgi:hypothetical protein